MQVSINVKKKKITSVSVANSPEEGRSVFIQDQAIPAAGLTQPHLETYEVTMNG